MWFCFNNAFVSAVEHRDNPNLLMVRARRSKDLENLFPGKEIIVGGSTDYNYRVIVSKDEFSKLVAERVNNINYDNFKNSVKDEDLKILYHSFWYLHYRMQDDLERKKGKSSYDFRMHV